MHPSSPPKVSSDESSAWADRSAVVQLITDTQSEVAAMLRESRVQALFKGNGGRDLELDYIDDDGGIAVGR